MPELLLPKIVVWVIVLLDGFVLKEKIIFIQTHPVWILHLFVRVKDINAQKLFWSWNTMMEPEIMTTSPDDSDWSDDEEDYDEENYW